MELITDKWVELAKLLKLDGEDVSEEQQSDMQKAFYLGALSMFGCIEQIIESDMTEEEVKSSVERLRDECVVVTKTTIASDRIRKLRR